MGMTDGKTTRTPTLEALTPTNTLPVMPSKIMGGDNDAANDNFGQWYSSYNPDDKTWDKNMPAISSFPHNDLGKDFRFNVRILHHGGNGDPDSDCGDENRDGEACKDSYYWYK